VLGFAVGVLSSGLGTSCFGCEVLIVRFWVLGLGSGVWVSGFRFWVLSFGCWVSGFGFWILGRGFWVLGVELWV
jgi:hypothetical protein